jgi:nucleoside-diphosphate-sugar epimerase
MKILFIGGTGIISSACSALAVERGFELFLLNRGKSSRPAPEGARILNGDIRDPASVEKALNGHSFDAVVDWIAFTPEQVQADLDYFRGKTAQYVFISSASAYQKPVGSLPITESTPLINPHWAYSRAKIASCARPARKISRSRSSVHRTPTIARSSRRRAGGRRSTGCAGARRSSCTATARRPGC